MLQTGQLIALMALCIIFLFIGIYLGKMDERPKRLTVHEMRSIQCMQLIDGIRSEECWHVEICADNADFSGPNSCVVVEGFWPENEERMFFGESILQCLRTASIEVDRARSKA